MLLRVRGVSAVVIFALSPLAGADAATFRCVQEAAAYASNQTAQGFTSLQVCVIADMNEILPKFGKPVVWTSGESAVGNYIEALKAGGGAEGVAIIPQGESDLFDVYVMGGQRYTSGEKIGEFRTVEP